MLHCESAQTPSVGDSIYVTGADTGSDTLSVSSGPKHFLKSHPEARATGATGLAVGGRESQAVALAVDDGSGLCLHPCSTGSHLEASAVETQQLQRLCELVAGRAAGLPVKLLLRVRQAPVR